MSSFQTFGLLQLAAAHLLVHEAVFRNSGDMMGKMVGENGSGPRCKGGESTCQVSKRLVISSRLQPTSWYLKLSSGNQTTCWARWSAKSNPDLRVEVGKRLVKFPNDPLLPVACRPLLGTGSCLPEFSLHVGRNCGLE